jgi:hypothetical protein
VKAAKFSESTVEIATLEWLAELDCCSAVVSAMLSSASISLSRL